MSKLKSRINSEYDPSDEDVANQDQMVELNLGLKYTGPQSELKVYKRTRKSKGGTGPGVVEGEKETNEDTNLCKDTWITDARPTNFLRPDSPTLDGGSGLKEVAT